MAPGTIDIGLPGEGGVLDALLVDVEVVAVAVCVASVDAVLVLVERLGLLDVAADVAPEGKGASSLSFDAILVGVEEVVALLAETHSRNRHCRLALKSYYITANRKDL